MLSPASGVGGWIATQGGSVTVGGGIQSDPALPKAPASSKSPAKQPPSHPGGASNVGPALASTEQAAKLAVSVVGKMHPPSGGSQPHCPHVSSPASRSMAPV